VRADAAANRAALLRAAQRLFAERGSTAIPYSTIAQEARVGIGTLYRHFPQPEDLVSALVAEAGEQVLAICERFRPLVATDPGPAWSAFVDELVLAEVASFLPAVVGDVDEVPPALELARDEVTTAVADILDMARAARLVPVDLDVTRFLVGLVVVTRPLPEPAPVHVDGLRTWLGRVYREGLLRQAT
jgi:AcrR family transcriptional regulator